MAGFESVTRPDYLDGLEEWPSERVLAARGEVSEIELTLSYLRRILQERLGGAEVGDDWRQVLASADVGKSLAHRLEEVLLRSEPAVMAELRDEDRGVVVEELTRVERSVTNDRRAVIGIGGRLEQELSRRRA